MGIEGASRAMRLSMEKSRSMESFRRVLSKSLAFVLYAPFVLGVNRPRNLPQAEVCYLSFVIPGTRYVGGVSINVFRYLL